MTIDEIKNKFINREINSEQTLESLNELGYTFNLLNDDNGHWALSADGFQNVAKGDEPEDMAITCFIESSYWKDSIYEAVLYIVKGLE